MKAAKRLFPRLQGAI